MSLRRTSRSSATYRDFDNLANIKRSLLCAEELSNTGLSVIPYIAGITARDWEHWADLLRDHQTIRIVCKEFQTGPSSNIKAAWHVTRLHELQQRVGRPLHIIAIGGRRHLALLRDFASLTVIDSVPFMRTMHRRMLTMDGWQDAPTPSGAPLDHLLQHNVTAYAERVSASRNRVAVLARTATAIKTLHEFQLSLWPAEHDAMRESA